MYLYRVTVNIRYLGNNVILNATNTMMMMMTMMIHYGINKLKQRRPWNKPGLEREQTH